VSTRVSPPCSASSQADLAQQFADERGDPGSRDTADVILIATGPNELETVFSPLQEGTCGGTNGYDCIRALGQTWSVNLDAILTEIVTLREGRPTVIRLVNAANPFVSVPEMNEGLPEVFATGGALILELLTVATCDAAAPHSALCVDVRPILNGAELDQLVDENSQESMQAVADALAATDVPEVGQTSSQADFRSASQSVAGDEGQSGDDAHHGDEEPGARVVATPGQ
jgi:hypothetical protein